MIGIVDVEVQAANPQMPLCPFVAFVGSPSSVRVRNVPGNIGSWNITKVYVSANYPDNSIQSRECTRVGEIYVGTLPACNAVGKGENGFVVSADGVDENGNAVTGYVLGKGDLEILDADGAITPGVTTHYVHGLDEQPSDPHEYDIYKDGDTWKIYFNGAWGPLAPALTIDDNVTRTSGNGVKSSGIWSMIWGALTALPSGFSSIYGWIVSTFATKADATLTERGPNHDGFSAWTIFRDGVDVTAQVTVMPRWIENVGWFVEPVVVPGDSSSADVVDAGQDALYLNWKCFHVGTELVYTASRTALPGYQLGSQTDKPLASEAEAEALRTAITAVAPEWVSGSSYAKYDVVKYNGVYYCAKSDISTSTAAPSSDTTHWGALANLAALAHLFLPLTGGTVGGSIEFTSNNGPVLDDIIIRKIDDGVVEFYNGYNGFSIKLAAEARGYAASVGDIAPVFSTASTYAQNALCVHNGVLYRCTTAVTTPEEWTAAHWTEATVQDVFANLSEVARTGSYTNLLNKPTINGETVNGNKTSGDYNLIGTDNIGGYLADYALMTTIADEFSYNTHYAVGDLCIYMGASETTYTLYKCTTAHHGTWNASHFESATVEDVLAALRTGKANKVAGATAGNLAALDANGNPTDAGYHFEVRGGIPCIVQYT